MTTFGILMGLLAGLLLGGLAMSIAGRGRDATRQAGPYERLVRGALARLATGDHEGTVATLRQATSMRARDDAVYLLLAEELRRTGDLSRAERAADVLLASRDLAPEVACGAYLLKGRLAERRGEVEAALDAYARAEAARPDATEPIVFRGRLLSRLRRWEEAIEAADRLARIAPERGRLIAARRRVLLARELLAAGRAAEAATEAKAALAAVPQLTAARITMGDALFQQGRVKEATEAWLKAARSAPGRAALVLDRLEQAAPSRQAAAELAAELAATGGDWRTLAWLASHALAAGRLEEAERHAGRLLRAAPATATAARLETRLAAARDGEPGPALTALLARWGRDRTWIDPWRCGRCGREMPEFEWRCPTCQAWNSLG